MYITYVNHDSVSKQICQLKGNAYLINETALMNKRKRKATLLHNEELDLCMRMWTRLAVECVT